MRRSKRFWLGLMAPLPRRIRLGSHRVRFLLCHGSPRRINEFLWRTTTPDPFLERLFEEQKSEVIVCTHTGPHGTREFRVAT